MTQHSRLSSPFYSKPPTPAKLPWTVNRGAQGLWYVRMPDGTDRGPMCHKKVARKSITLYRRLWEAEQSQKAARKAQPRPKLTIRKEVAA
jgi:hypothetical protein